jgi:hypothetical protein
VSPVTLKRVAALSAEVVITVYPAIDRALKSPAKAKSKTKPKTKAKKK